HLVPVDRQAGTAQIGPAGEAETAAGTELAEAIAPVGALDHGLNALLETDRADLQPVGGERVGLGEHAEAQIRRISTELFCDLVELDLLAEARLRRAMAALGSARRLVGKDARGLELVLRQLIRHRLQRTGVESARDAIGAVAAAIDQR